MSANYLGGPQKGGAGSSIARAPQPIASAGSSLAGGNNSGGPFKAQGPQPLKKLQGVKTYPAGQTPPENFLPLEKVIGMSSKGSTSISINPVNGDIAYPAGAVICIYSPKENKQSRFLYNNALQRSYSCLAYSPDGRFLAAGEGKFKQPEITIWEIDQSGDYIESKHLRGHKYGIESVLFSPNMLHLISLGDANDRGLFVWDWRNEKRRTSNKLGKPVNNFSFALSSEFFVTAGYQHLKYWNFDDIDEKQTQGAGEGEGVERIMESKSADLTKVKVKIFVGVQCTQNGGASGKDDQVLALASDGHLYVYDKNRKLSKWMSIKVERALSCAIGGSYLYCACTEGIVRIFNTKTLEYIFTIPKPPPLGQANVEAGKKIRIATSKDAKFADALAVQLDEKNQRALVLYSDRMVFIWDMKQMDKISVFRTLYSHSGAIYDMQYIPNTLNHICTIPESINESILGEDDISGLTKFATCSADRTVRFWYFLDPASSNTPQQMSKLLVKNAYQKDMSKMIYVSSESRDSNGSLIAPTNPHAQFKVPPTVLNEDGTPKQEESVLQSRDVDQLRCIRVSPNGKHLACGDWGGNIRIHDLENSSYEEVQCIQAHDGEIVCLDYTPASIDRCFLVSGSRDRLTQIYERIQENYYQNVAILDDHSSTISQVKFLEERSTQPQRKRLKLVTSGNDKMLVVRSVLNESDANGAPLQTQVVKTEQCKTKIFSMDVSQSGHAITGHDKYMQLWSVTQQGSYERGMERRVESNKKQAVLDSLRVFFGAGPGHSQGFSDIFLQSCADKSVTMYETLTGNIICRTTCGEVTLAMCLSTNLRHLITASIEGIIYIWRLPEPVSKSIVKLRQESIANKKLALPVQPLLLQVFEEASSLENVDRKTSDEFDFVGKASAPQPPDSRILQGSNIASSEDSSILDDSQFMQPPPSISFIMGEISKVAGKIEKIQPIKSRAQATYQDEGEPFHQSNPSPELKQPENNPVNQKRRNPWAQPVSGQAAPIQLQVEAPKVESLNEGGGLMDTAELVSKKNTEPPRPLQLKESRLPDWAKSVARASEFFSQQSQVPPEVPEDEADEDMEDIFSNTLQKANSEIIEPQPSNEPLEINSVLQAPQVPNGVVACGEYDDDPEEIHVEEQINKHLLRQRKQIGLEDDDEDDQHIQLLNENRLSQSQLFFQRRRITNHNELVQKAKEQPVVPERQSQAEALKVEDIFNELAVENYQDVEGKLITPVKAEEPVHTVENPYPASEIQRVGSNSAQPAEVLRQPLVEFINDSIAESETSLVKIQQQHQQQQMIPDASLLEEEESKELSSAIEQELETINAALLRIQAQVMRQSNQQPSLSTGNFVRREVLDKLGRSMELFGSVQSGLTFGGPSLASQSLQFGSLQPPAQQPSQNQLMTFSANQRESSMSGMMVLQQSPLAPPLDTSMANSLAPSVDARDLLEKYSDLLLQEVLRKLKQQ